jgi:hypothetical protein
VREADLEASDRKAARAAGWLVVKIMRASPNGFPDRFYARGGRIVLIEWKRPGGRLSEQQKHRHAELRAAGVEVYTVDNLEDARVARGDA